MESKIKAFAASCYGIMLGIKLQDCISNNANYSMTNTESLVHCVRERQLGFLGRILRLPEGEPAGRCTFYVHLIARGGRDVHAPCTSHASSSCLDIVKLIYMSVDEMATLVEDRCAWRNLVIA